MCAHHCMRGKRGVRGKKNKNKDKRSYEAERVRLERAIAKATWYNKINCTGTVCSAQLGAASSSTDPADTEARSLLTYPLPSKEKAVSIDSESESQPRELDNSSTEENRTQRRSLTP